jgi:hypothetical protein
VDELSALISDLREQRECVELAECYGRRFSLDPTNKTAIVAFDAPWKLCAPLYRSFEVPADLLGRFGRDKPLDSIKRLRFGSYWITPVVRSQQAIGYNVQSHHGIRYVSCGEDGQEKRAADLYWSPQVVPEEAIQGA